MKYTMAIAKMRNRLSSLGVPPDSVIAGPIAWRELATECTTFRVTAVSGLRSYEDIKNDGVLPITSLHIMDLVVYESHDIPPEAMYIGIGLKP